VAWFLSHKRKDDVNFSHSETSNESQSRTDIPKLQDQVLKFLHLVERYITAVGGKRDMLTNESEPLYVRMVWECRVKKGVKVDRGVVPFEGIK